MLVFPKFVVPSDRLCFVVFILNCWDVEMLKCFCRSDRMKSFWSQRSSKKIHGRRLLDSFLQYQLKGIAKNLL